MRIGIFIFRRDLRLKDNIGLFKLQNEVKKQYYKRPGENKSVWGLVCCTNNKCVQELNDKNILNREKKYSNRIMNRDTNAVLNMLKIIDNLILTGKRPDKYERNI